jgi:hypothetical protein
VNRTGHPQAVKGHMYLGAQAAARTAKCFRPPFSARRRADAPGRWWNRQSDTRSLDHQTFVRRHQTPLILHRLKGRNTLFQSPNASGRSRQGEPVRTVHSTPSTNIRLSRPVEPFWSGRPMISGAIAPTPCRSELNDPLPSAHQPRGHRTKRRLQHELQAA